MLRLGRVGPYIHMVQLMSWHHGVFFSQWNLSISCHAIFNQSEKCFCNFLIGRNWPIRIEIDKPMRLFCVKMQQHDWFRMGHSDWLLGWGRFGPFGVMWFDCGQVLVTWLRQWWLSCAKNINPLCAGGSIFGNIKWRNNIKDFALLNNNMVVVFNLTMFGGIHLYIDDTCAIKLGPTQGPPLMFE